MMDHYEELGLERTASPEEIRRAYKRLVRLLHPDHCSDDSVRPLADLQMKRLNGVLRVLTNPAEREIYDRAVFGGPSPQVSLQGFPPVLPPPRPIHTPPWFWPVAGAAALLVLIAMLTYTPPSAPHLVAALEQPTPMYREVPEKQAGQGPRAGGRVMARSPDPVHVTTNPGRERSPATEPGASPPTASPPAAWDDAPALAETSHPSPSREQPVSLEQPISREQPLSRDEPVGNGLPAVPGVEPGHIPRVPPLSGVWLLLPSPRSKADGLYPPEYIELRLTEESGILHGRYSARYQIPDQAISPVVSFQFEGRAGPDRASLPWSGAGGARGEVRLRLVTSGTLEVSWVANQLSGDLGLISGTATLVRKLD